MTRINAGPSGSPVAQMSIAHGLGRAPSIWIYLMRSPGAVTQSAPPDGTHFYLTPSDAGVSVAIEAW